MVSPTFLDKIKWAYTAPISGLIGYQVLKKKLSLKKDNPLWRSSFHNKKVLIVGTGPSLDNVDTTYFRKFDTIIYLNHAIKKSNHVSDEYFFSTDINVVKDIYRLPYYRKISKLGPSKAIIAPIFFQQTLYLKEKFRNDFSWILASDANYKIHYSNSKVLRYKIPVTSILWPKQPSIEDLNTWYLQSHQVNFFPVIESTSALSAILFAAKYKPKYISLIGCDFGLGRSKDLEASNPGPRQNIFKESRQKFHFLSAYLKSKGLTVINESWN